jgi:hypothetical protein
MSGQRGFLFAVVAAGLAILVAQLKGKHKNKRDRGEDTADGGVSRCRRRRFRLSAGGFINGLSAAEIDRRAQPEAPEIAAVTLPADFSRSVRKFRALSGFVAAGETVRGVISEDDARVSALARDLSVSSTAASATSGRPTFAPGIGSFVARVSAWVRFGPRCPEADGESGECAGCCGSELASALGDVLRAVESARDAQSLGPMAVVTVVVPAFQFSCERRARVLRGLPAAAGDDSVTLRAERVLMAGAQTSLFWNDDARIGDPEAERWNVEWRQEYMISNDTLGLSVTVAGDAGAGVLPWIRDLGFFEGGAATASREYNPYRVEPAIAYAVLAGTRPGSVLFEHVDRVLAERERGAIAQFRADAHEELVLQQQQHGTVDERSEVDAILTHLRREEQAVVSSFAQQRGQLERLLL